VKVPSSPAAFRYIGGNMASAVELARTGHSSGSSRGDPWSSLGA